MDKAQYTQLEDRLSEIEDELDLCTWGSLDDAQEAMVDELRDDIMKVISKHNRLLARLDSAVQGVTEAE
jgi:hypothetical protein